MGLIKDRLRSNFGAREILGSRYVPSLPSLSRAIKNTSLGAPLGCRVYALFSRSEIFMEFQLIFSPAFVLFHVFFHN